MSELQIPNYVIEALAKVHESGIFNMFDRSGVINFINEDLDYTNAYEWLDENRDQYMNALNAMGEYVSNQQREKALRPIANDVHMPQEGDINNTNLSIGQVVQISDFQTVATITRINYKTVWVLYADGMRGCVHEDDCNPAVASEPAAATVERLEAEIARLTADNNALNARNLEQGRDLNTAVKQIRQLKDILASK